MDDTTMRLLRLAHKGYTCSQIIMIMGLEARAETNAALVRAMAGLAYGCGTGTGTCGTLTGACCLLALYAGKGGDNETASDRLMLMQEELNEWFARHTGSTREGIACKDIVGEAGPAAASQLCSALLVKTYAKVMELLAANGFDPLGG